MTQNQPQQQQAASFSIMKSAATPQHGRRPDAQAATVKDRRPVTPAPGH